MGIPSDFLLDCSLSKFCLLNLIPHQACIILLFFPPCYMEERSKYSLHCQTYRCRRAECLKTTMLLGVDQSLETSGPGADFSRARAPGRPREARAGSAWGGGGRRRNVLLLCAKYPPVPRLAARADRGHSLGTREQMEFGKTIHTLWMLPPPPPPPPATCVAAIVQAC